ncbi:hypothetical protein H8356DRAFT_1364141 [Neocallimastix lanati (nom. inval.)]|nr:hypothetical protein H8356DRAFT_1364141 [Neocallimastix sp. JGI-2020a]
MITDALLNCKKALSFNDNKYKIEAMNADLQNIYTKKIMIFKKKIPKKDGNGKIIKYKSINVARVLGKQKEFNMIYYIHQLSASIIYNYYWRLYRKLNGLLSAYLNVSFEKQLLRKVLYGLNYTADEDVLTILISLKIMPDGHGNQPFNHGY